MKTEIKITDRLFALHIIKKLERYDIKFKETETSIIADVSPAIAWNIGLI